MPSLLISITHRNPFSFLFFSFFYLAVPVILFPLTSVEAEKMFTQLNILKTKLFTVMSQEFLNALITIRHDLTSFDKINETVVDKLRNNKG